MGLELCTMQPHLSEWQVLGGKGSQGQTGGVRTTRGPRRTLRPEVGPTASGSPSLAVAPSSLVTMETNKICVAFALAKVLKVNILKTIFLHNPLMMGDSFFLLLFYCLFEIHFAVVYPRIWE